MQGEALAGWACNAVITASPVRVPNCGRAVSGAVTEMTRLSYLVEAALQRVSACLYLSETSLPAVGSPTLAIRVSWADV